MRAKGVMAFTLVEVLASMAIASMLLLAALATIGVVWRCQSVSSRRHEQGLVEHNVAGVLTCDLQHAERYSVPAKEGGFVLRGYSCLDQKSLALTHLAVVITYQVLKVDNDYYLVRRQRLDNQRESVQLVAKGVTQITLTPTQAGPGPANPASTSVAMPEAVTVTVQFDSPGPPLVVSFLKT